jgi:UDP-N-acetylmuramate--alanine ligase
MVYLGRTRRIHFVGIGGIGMSGIAEVLLNLGFEVSGSDIKSSELTEHLESMGAKISFSHKKENVHGADVVVYSSAVNLSNPEIVEAGKQTIPVIPRTEMLAELMRLKYAVTVAGAHGKTSTTSLVASVLSHGGLDPTVVVGGKLKVSSSNAVLGRGRYIVAEADESDGEFVKLPSTIAVITTIDLEHLDHYADMDAIKSAFIAYANKVPFYGSVILCLDDPNIRSIMPKVRRRKVTYGIDENGDIKGRVKSRKEDKTVFEIEAMGRKLGETYITMPGDHYVRNALAAVAVGMELEVPFDLVKQGLEEFQGVGRRFEIKDRRAGITIVDDYAHHPTEIAATMNAALTSFGGRVIVLFQPHRYTRTQAMADQFGECFRGAEKVFVADIYAAGEDPIPGVTSQLIIDAIRDAGIPADPAPTFEKMVEETMKILRNGDIVITMGAGDIHRAGRMLAERLG